MDAREVDLSAPLPNRFTVMSYGASGCLDAETIIPCCWQDDDYWNHHWMAIKDLQQRFTTTQGLCAYSINVAGVLFPNRVLAVVKSGRKACFKLTTTDGRTIVATGEHKFYIGAGKYAQLSELCQGSMVFVGAALPSADVKPARVNDIVAVGDRDTFDISMQAPANNFLANGFVVHNSGKSEWAATWPKPLFLSDGGEEGYETIRKLIRHKRSKLFDMNCDPQVRRIEDPGALMEELDRAEKLVAAGTVKTIVIDSLTFIGDMVLAEITRGLSKNSKEADNRQVYGKLLDYLRFVMLRAHRIKDANILWLALAKESADAAHPSGIMLAGQTAGKAPAACGAWLYHHEFRIGAEHRFEIHTETFGPYPARVRFGAASGSIADPLPEATYRGFLKALGEEVKKPEVSVRAKVAGNIVAKPTTTRL